MERKVLFGILVVILLAQFALAAVSEIAVKTLPGHEVQISTFDASIVDYSVIKNFRETSDEYGDVKVDLITDKKFNIIIFVKQDGETVITEEYLKSYSPGEPVEIMIAPDWFEYIQTPSEDAEEESLVDDINETEKEELVEEIEEEKEAKSEISGLTIGSENSGISKLIRYIIGALIIIAVAGFMIAKHVMKAPSASSKEKEIKVRSLKEMQEKHETKAEELERIQEKIEEAQKELRKFKNEDKIAQAEKKMKEDQEALERLRRGED